MSCLLCLRLLTTLTEHTDDNGLYEKENLRVMQSVLHEDIAR